MSKQIQLRNWLPIGTIWFAGVWLFFNKLRLPPGQSVLIRFSTNRIRKVQREAEKVQGTGMYDDVKITCVSLNGL